MANLLDAGGSGASGEQPTLPVVPKHTVIGDDELNAYARRVSLFNQFHDRPSGFPGHYDQAARTSILTMPASVQYTLINNFADDEDVRTFLHLWQTETVRNLAAEDYAAFQRRKLDRDLSRNQQTRIWEAEHVPAGTKRADLVAGRAADALGFDPALIDVSHAFGIGVVRSDILNHLLDTTSGIGEKALELINDHVLMPPARAMDHFYRTIDAMGYELGGKNTHPLAVLDRFKNLPHFKDFWHQETTTPGTMGQAFADSLGVDHTSAEGKALSFATDFYFRTKVDPIIAFSTLRKGWKAVDLAASTDIKLQDKVLESAGVRRAAAVLAKVDNPATVSRYMRAFGADVQGGALTRIARAKSEEEVIDVLRDGFRMQNGILPGEVRVAPRMYREPFGLMQRTTTRFETPRLFRTLPSHGPVNVLAADAEREVHDLARQFFPKEAERVNGYVADFLAADRSGKVDVVEKIVREGLNAKGITDDVIAQAERRGDSWFSYIKARRTYGAQLADSGNPELPMFSPQRQYKLSVPDYFSVRQAQLSQIEGPAGKALRGIETGERAVLEAQGHVKTVWLLTGGFPARVTMDEILSSSAYFHLRPTEYIKQFSTAWVESMTHSPHAVIEHAGKALERVLDSVGSLPGFQAIKPLKDAPEVSNRLLMSAHGREWRFDGPLPAGVSKQEGTMLRELAKTHEVKANDWIYVSGDHPHWDRMAYQFVNHHILGDPIGVIIAENFDNPKLQERLIANFLATDKGQQYIKGMARTISALRPQEEKALRAAIRSQVGVSSEQQAQALATYAESGQGLKKFVETQRKIFERVIPEHLRPLAATGEIDLEDFTAIPQLERPPVPGFSTTPKAKVGQIYTWVKQIEDSAYAPISDFVDNMVRKPVYRTLYGREYDRLLAAARSSGALGTEVSEEQLSMAAHNYTLRTQAPMVHDPSKRTVFDAWTRSFIPFNFAFVQFTKRWAKVLVENPGLARRFNILMDTGINDGWFDQNENGDVTFNIPAAGGLASWIGRKLQLPSHSFDNAFRVTVNRKEQAPSGALGSLEAPFRLFNKAALPPLLPFSAHTLPGFGPVVTIPIDFLTATRPQFEQVRDFILGPKSSIQPGEGAAQRILGQLSPSWVDKFSKGFAGDEGDRAWANANKDALAWAAFHDLDPFDKKVRDKMANMTRAMYFVRGALQFFSPYTPTPNTPGMEIVSEYRTLQNQLGPEKGRLAFLDKYGEKGFLFTVPYTKVKNKSVPFASEEANAFFNDHQDFFYKFPNAAGFLAPAGEFSSSAYNAQIASGQRNVLTIEQWLGEVAARKGDDFFYSKVKPAYQKGIDAGLDPHDLSLWLKAQQAKIDDAYPGWMSWHVDWERRALANQESIAELQLAALDPVARDTPQGKAIREFLLDYNRAFDKVQRSGYTSWKSNAVEPIKAWVISRYNDIYARTQSPQLKRAYDYLFRGTLEGFKEDE